MDHKFEKDDLSKDDLFILMKTYENSIAINTTLLQYIKTISQTQSEEDQSLKNIIEKINNMINTLQNISKIQSDNIEIKKQITEKLNSILTQINVKGNVK
jgi:hypothetical protein